jgi:hypothetical protein
MKWYASRRFVGCYGLHDADGPEKTTPFGGVQVLFIGDLLQLPPVIQDEEWRTLRTYYKEILFSFACGAAKSALILNYQNFPSDRFHLYFCFE